MANMLDYFKWRGDLTLANAPFNTVDSLVLSCIAYVDVHGLVGGYGEAPVRLGDVCAHYCALPESEQKARVRRVNEFEEHDFMCALADCPRFCNMLVLDAVDHFDTVHEEQFAALTICTGDDMRYLAYRGTDNTLVGWREDFNMSFCDNVPSQRAALAYLTRAAQDYQGTLRLGGHSKGGNLAVFAAAHADERVRAQIQEVYNNDGPGFSANMVQTEGYQAILTRVKTYVPQSSIIGMLLEHEESYAVIHSTQVSILQHNPYTWQILGAKFVCVEDVTVASRRLDVALKKWLNDMDIAQRQAFVDALFTVLSATKATTFADMASDWFKSAGAVHQAFIGLDPASRDQLTQTLGRLVKSITSLAFETNIAQPVKNVFAISKD